MMPKKTHKHAPYNHLVSSGFYRSYKVIQDKTVLYKSILLALFLLLLSSCQSLPVIQNEQTIIDENLPIDTPQVWAQQQSWFKPFFLMENINSAVAVAELSKYFIHSHTLSKKELKREIAITERAYTNDSHPSIALSFAYLLTINPSTKYLKRSKTLLNILIEDDITHENYRAFAQLLLLPITGHSTHRRLLRNATTTNKALNKQLEALKNIELKINERQPTAGSTELTP
ncbi:MAG: hypothetical protein ACJA2B_000827 [Candidatus Endobugula sp.]|jgi:hypothetical protein